jgi:hypothetical protein
MDPPMEMDLCTRSNDVRKIKTKINQQADFQSDQQSSTRVYAVFFSRSFAFLSKNEDHFSKQKTSGEITFLSFEKKEYAPRFIIFFDFFSCIRHKTVLIITRKKKTWLIGRPGKYFTLSWVHLSRFV